MMTPRVGAYTIDWTGLSTDEEPTEHVSPAGEHYDIPNGSIMLKMDTKQWSAWDLENKRWRPQT